MSASRVLLTANPCHRRDPFFWRTKRGYHAIFHYDGATHAFSEDAKEWWIAPSYAYTPIVEHTDGTQTEYVSRERPKLALDPVDQAPVAITSAVRAPWIDARCKPAAGAKAGVPSGWNVRAPYCDAAFTHVQLVGE